MGIFVKLVEAAQSATGPAVILAAVIEGEDPDVLIARAVARFRCISWVVLFRMPGIIVGGSTLDGQQASAELYKLSGPCSVGECDAFFSHSWHDDSHHKWNALSDWCTEFESTNKRSPRMWLD